MGGGRALFLLFVFPRLCLLCSLKSILIINYTQVVIARFKPKSNLPKPLAIPGVKAAKPKPTKEHLAREIKFDLRLSRISLCIDIVANTAIVLAPAPSNMVHSLFMDSKDPQFRSSQALFVVASWTASWGAGLVPAIHSLALSIIQARALLEASSGEGTARVVDGGTGRLFGALAVLQAIGQMILGVSFPCFLVS